MGLTSNSITVTMVDGSTSTVRTIYRDTVAYETAARKHKWGPIGESFVTAQGFIVWYALRRTGQIPTELTYEKWLDDVDSIDRVDPDDVETVEPTPPGPTPG